MSVIVDKSGDRVRRMFGSIANRYDRMNHLLSLNVDRYWRWTTVRKVAPRGSAPVLDVCTGTGDLALAYWRVAKGRVPVVGADFCPEMLERARQKQCAAGIADNLTFVEADAMCLPWESSHFQIVAVAFGLRNMEDTEQGLREMIRICQPGGRVVVLEFSLPSRQPFKSIYGLYFRTVLPRLGQWLARNDESAYEYLPQSVEEFPSGGTLAQQMESMGLRDVRFIPLTMGTATLYVGAK
jgi:demethylmenaquinone methyltransferase/2-methoxy-6-polyprenyl-1,4-benzoquinol methylase